MTSIQSSSQKSRNLKPLLIFLFGFMLSVLGSLAFLAVIRSGFIETNVVSQVSSLMGITAKTPWHLTRAAGTVAYLLMVGSMVWGLLLSSKIVKETVPAALALAMHNILSWLAIALTGLHAVALLFDNYFTYTLADLTIPFIGPYRPVEVGLGIIGFYIMFLISISFNFRKQFGQKRWRKLHYLTFGAFLLTTFHGIMAGSGSGNLVMQIVYWGSGLAVLFLTNYRILTRKR